MGMMGCGFDASANARDIVQDFLHRIEAIIALKHDGRRRVTRQRIGQEVERLGRHRVRMGIGEERLLQVFIVHDDRRRPYAPPGPARPTVRQ